MRIRMAVILLFSVCSAGLAEHPCTVPVTVVTPDLSSAQKAVVDAMDWQPPLPALKYQWLDFITPQLDTVPVTNLSADAFLVHDKKTPVRIQSATYDRGPRRVIFVAENGKMPQAARKIEAEVITHILSKARTEDSFALLTARGPRVELRFGSSREAIRAAAEELARPPQGKAGGEGVLDAVLEATTWFQPPQAGDSIFLMALNVESKHRASFSSVRDAVTAGRIRVFGFELGEVSQPPPLGSTSDYFPNTPDVGFGNRNHLLDLTRESGGRFAFDDTEVPGYRLTDARLGVLRYAGESMYKPVTEHYLLQLDSTGPNVSIRLAPSVLSGVPWVTVSYPTCLPACSSTPTRGSRQQPPCTVTVNVSIPDLSSLPKAAADTVAAEWKQNIQAQKYELPPGSWNQQQASRDFARSLNRATQPKKALVDDLTADAFVAHDKERPVRIQSVTYDRGPRRIVFVAENGNMPAWARKIETEVIANILSKARAIDSLALLTAGGPRVELRFGSSRESLRAAVEELGNPPRDKSGGKGVLDAVLEATTWLQPPQPGDSIFFMTGGLQGTLRARPSKVRAALAAGRIRLFGIQFGGYDYRMAQLTGDSGGWGTWPGFMRDERDDRLRGFIHDGEEMYMEATEHYLLQFDSFGAHLTIGLAPATQSQLPWAEVQYPKYLPPCSSPATPTPAHTETPR